VASFEGYIQKTEDLPHELRNAALYPISDTLSYAYFERSYFPYHLEDSCHASLALEDSNKVLVLGCSGVLHV
jgi:hypothetical protein